MTNAELNSSDIYGLMDFPKDEQERFERLIKVGSTLYKPSIQFNKVVIEKFTVVNSRNVTDQKLLIILKPESGDPIFARWKRIKFNDGFEDYYSRKEDAIYIARKHIKKLVDSVNNMVVD